MQIKYRIIKIHPEDHSITVRYYTDVLTEDKLAVNYDTFGNIVRNQDGTPTNCRTDYYINVFKVPSPTPEEIDELAKRSAPVEWLNMQEFIANNSVDTSMTSLQPMINIEKEISQEDLERIAPILFVSSNTSTSNT